jgi:hypothetical protein
MIDGKLKWLAGHQYTVQDTRIVHPASPRIGLAQLVKGEVEVMTGKLLRIKNRKRAKGKGAQGQVKVQDVKNRVTSPTGPKSKSGT